jgi:hypothetical protein
MKKLQMLYQFLLGTGLFKPEQLRLFVDEGCTTFEQTGMPEGDDKGNLPFYRRYSVNVTITAYGGSVDKIDAALVWWLGLHETERAGRSNGYSFEAEIIDAATVNLFYTIPLSERVIYNTRTQQYQHCVRPVRLDGGSLDNLPLYFVDARAGETTTPAGGDA